MSNIPALVETLLNASPHEGTLDYHGLHGFLTAQAICPAKLTEKQRNESIFDGDVNFPPATSVQWEQLIDNIEAAIDRGFNDEDEGFVLSCEAVMDGADEALSNWCTGFMVAHFLNEETWFINNEQEVCELLLPIMLASGLFDEEPEFKEIRKNNGLTEDMFSQIPEVLMELFLMFNAPEEKKSHHRERRR